MFHERAKHIEVDCYVLRDQFKNELITLHHITTYHQLEDVLTKSLTGVRHCYSWEVGCVFYTSNLGWGGGVLRLVRLITYYIVSELS